MMHDNYHQQNTFTAHKKATLCGYWSASSINAWLLLIIDLGAKYKQFIMAATRWPVS